MSGDVENSQAARDAARAAADLAHALRVGAPSAELVDLETVKAQADERVAVLRRRVESAQEKARRAQADLLERRKRRREGNNQNRQHDATLSNNTAPSTSDGARRQQHVQAEEDGP